MSPKTSRKHTIKVRLERSVPGIGRVSIRTGARIRAEHQARIALFDRLLEGGQLDTIRLLIDGQLSWIELRQAQRKNRLHSDTLAADIALSRGLWDALEKTAKRMGKTLSTRERYALAFRQLRSSAADFLPETAIVKDLGSAPWADVFQALGELSPASRNRVRSGLSAFLTVFLGDKFHPFRRAVMRSMGAMESEATPPKDITADEFWTNVKALHEAIQPIVITLAGSGLRIGEFLRLNDLSAKRLPLIWLPGGKTGSGERSIAPALLHIAQQAIPCRIAPTPTKYRGVQYDARYKRIWKEMAKAAETTGIPWSPHYLRHLYAQLATDELPSVLAQQGLGHSTSAMTDRYAKRRTTAKVSAVVGSALLAGKGAKGALRGVGKGVGRRSRKAS